jgi:hypothetical protein
LNVTQRGRMPYCVTTSILETFISKVNVPLVNN